MIISEKFFLYDAVIIIYDFIVNTVVVFVVNIIKIFLFNYLNTSIKYLKCSNTLSLIDIPKLTKGSIFSQSETHS